MPPPTRRPTTDEGPSLVPQPEQESVGVAANMPRHVLVALMALLAGGVGTVGYLRASPSPADLVSSADVAGVATEARRYTDESQHRAVEERRREIAQGQAVQVQALIQVTSTMVRLETKMDLLSLDLTGIKLDVAAMKGRPR